MPIDPTLWLQRAQITISGVMRTTSTQNLADVLWLQPSPFGEDAGPAEARLWREEIDRAMYNSGRKGRRRKRED